MADFKNLDVYKKVTLYWGKYYGNFPSTQSSFGEYSMQRGFLGSKGVNHSIYQMLWTFLNEENR